MTIPETMLLSIIVAMAKNRVIGNKGKIPWHLPEDLKRFKQLTMGHPIIMGRKTFDSIGKPLPGRTNIVITRNKQFSAQGVVRADNLDDAIRKAGGQNEIFVIGGAEIYREALPRADKIYLTLIEQEFEGDTFFPEVELEKEFRIVEEGESQRSAKSGLLFRFITYQRHHTR